MSYQVQKKILLFGFLFFPIVLMILFFIIPTIRMVFYSFTDWDGVLPTYNFVGSKNIVNVLSDPIVWQAIRNNGVYLLVGLIQNCMSLLFAVMLNSMLRGRGFYKTVIFLPYVLNITAAAYMFSYFYNFSESPVNLLLASLGLNPVKFFEPDRAIFSLAFMSLWRWLGHMTVVYIAALQSIDTQIYEASDIDGANTVQTFFLITLPNIRRTLELLLFLSLSGAMQAFTESFILTKGGPGQSTFTYMYYVITSYVTYNSYGYAAALSLFLVLIIVIITVLQRILISLGDKKHAR